MCQGSVKGDLRKFYEGLKEVSMVFEESFNGVSRKIEGCFNEVLSLVRWYLKEVQKKVSNVYQGAKF